MTLGTWVGFGWVGMITIGIFSFLDYITGNNREFDTKYSGYDPCLGLPTQSRMPWMTLSTWVSLGWVGMITIGLFLCLFYISANNRDIGTKLSAYDPWGLTTTARTL